MANDLVLRVSLPTPVSQSAVYSVGDVGPAGGIIYSVIPTGSNDFQYLEAGTNPYSQTGINGAGTRTTLNNFMVNYTQNGYQFRSPHNKYEAQELCNQKAILQNQPAPPYGGPTFWGFYARNPNGCGVGSFSDGVINYQTGAGCAGPTGPGLNCPGGGPDPGSPVLWNARAIRSFLQSELPGVNYTETYDLDTPSDIDFRIDLSAIENTEIGSVFGVASQTFELPSSKTNDEFFSAAFNVNSTSVRGLKNSVDCQVLSNGGEIFKGNLVLKEVITDGYNNTTYSVEVVNETIDFQTLIQDQFISDLDFSDYTHSYTMASVTSSWTGSLFGGDIVYPLADYGVDSSDSTLPLIELGGQRGKMDNPNTPLKTIQFKPAIRAKAVLDNIFESVGYKYSSSFFDSSDFQNIYVLPTATDKLGIQSQAYQDGGFYVNKTTSQNFTNSPSYSTITWEQEQWDPTAGFNLATDTFTVQTAGQYAFRLELNVSAPDGTDTPELKEFTIRLKVNGGSSFAQFYDLVGNTTGVMTFVTPGQTLAPGDTVSLDARYRMITLGTDPDAVITGGFFQTIYAPTALVGGNVDMGQQFEESAKSVDFLAGLIEMFNLVVEPKKDERKTLIIEPFDTWRDAGVIKDWTQKWDTATKISIKHPIQDQPRTLIHQLEDDDDALNVYSKAQFDRDLPYGTNTYTADSDIAQGERKVGSFFAPTPTKGVVGGNNIIIPHLYKAEAGEKKPIKFKPRLLYLIPNRGTLDAVAGKIWVKQESGFTVGITSYATMNHLSSLPANNSTKSLHFNANRWYPYHNNFAYGYTINGLFNEYWGRYINELYDDEARVMTCNIHFDPYELPTIQLNDKIFIKDAYYRINKISGYNLSKRASVQVELLKAPVSRFKFKRHRGVRIGDITADLTLSDFNPISGQATYVDVETGQTYSSGSFLKNIAKLDALAFQGDKAVYTPEYNLILQTDNRNNLDGNLNQDASIGYALGSITEGSVGKDVDRAFAVGSNINLQQNAKSVMTIGDNLTIGTGSTYSTILNTDGASISGENNYGFIIGGTGSAIIGGDYVGIINGNVTTARDSDFTTIINGHPLDVVLNGNGHVVMNMDKAGAGIDFLNYRENSNYLGDTYFGGSQFIEPETLTCGDGTTINLYDTQYQDNSLFILNWTGFSPGTTTINLPNLTNNDYKKIHYRIKANGTFDGTTKVNFIPFTSPQTIQGFASASFSSSYDYIELYANGAEWLILDGGGSISISGSGGSSISSSYATTASYAQFAVTASCSNNVKTINYDQPDPGIFYYTQVQSTGSECKQLSTLDLIGLRYDSNTNTHTMDSNLFVSGSITALDISASYAVTASYISPTFISASAAASGFGSGGGASTFPFTGSAIISGSLTITGSVNVTGSVTATSFVGDGSGLTNLPSTSAVGQNKFYDADTFVIDVPGDTTATPVDIHVSQSGVYFISCSGVPAGVAGPRANIYYWPELLGNNETAKLKIHVPGGDTLTGFTFKANITGSTATEYYWYTTSSPASTTATNLPRLTGFSRLWSSGPATMVKDGNGRVFIINGIQSVNVNNIFYTGTSVNPLV